MTNTPADPLESLPLRPLLIARAKLNDVEFSRFESYDQVEQSRFLERLQVVERWTSTSNAAAKKAIGGAAAIAASLGITTYVFYDYVRKWSSSPSLSSLGCDTPAKPKNGPMQANRAAVIELARSIRASNPHATIEEILDSASSTISPSPARSTLYKWLAQAGMGRQPPASSKRKAMR